MFHVYYEYHLKRVTLCVALQIMADVITVDNAITLEARKVLLMSLKTSAMLSNRFSRGPTYL